VSTQTKKTALAVVAHPDDAEFLCAGALSLLHKRGWRIVMATMTPGDCGSMELDRVSISELRRREAAESAAILDAAYHCLECDDAFILYDRATILKATALIRETRPDIVFTMSPDDYMVDHEMTSKIVQTACFTASIKNIETPDILPTQHIPYLYYLDPIEGKDKYGNEVQPGTIIDITEEISRKVQMLACHASQRSWLQQQHGIDEYIIAMKDFSARRGELIAAEFAEGFRQHLGHAYPQDNILKQALGERAV
jgi:LmbE family N-acetylglucosaminyl deacetylase